MTASLTGTWHGLYSYPNAAAPEGFVARLIESGGYLSGTIDEKSADRHGRRQSRSATVEGTVQLPNVTFVKRYSSLSECFSDPVFYVGHLAPDGTEIEGRWHIPGDWSGPFLMIRDSALPIAEFKRRFADLDA